MFEIYHKHILPTRSPNGTNPYYGYELAHFREWYETIHGYASLVVCGFGTLTNILNIIVFTRKNMASPVNNILTYLAIADLFVVVPYIPYAVHNFFPLDKPDVEKYTYPWAVFILAHGLITIVFRSISTWLTVLLAIWRFIAVTFPESRMIWCSPRRTKYSIISIYIACPIVCIPVYFCLTIFSFVEEDAVLYRVALSETALRNSRFVALLSFWFPATLANLLPCIAMAVLIVGIIRALSTARTYRRRHLQAGGVESDDSGFDKVTRMLLAILLLFEFTIGPLGIMAFLSGVLGGSFYYYAYRHFGEVLDMVTMINSSFNFIFYYTMVRQFRTTLGRLFLPKTVIRRISGIVTGSESNTTKISTIHL